MDEREQLVAAVWSLLDEVDSTGDLTPVLEDSETLHQASRLARYAEEHGDLEARHLLGHLHWYRYQALPEGEDQADLAAAVEQFLHSFMAAEDGIPEPLLPLVADHAAPIVIALVDQGDMDAADDSTVNAIVELFENIVDATAAGDESLAARLSYLARTLIIRFDRADAPEDLEAANEALRAAAAATPVGHPAHAPVRNNLARVLHTRYQRLNTPEDLDGAIEALEEALDASAPDAPEGQLYEKNLGRLLRERYLSAYPHGSLDDLERAVGILRRSLDGTPADDPERSRWLSDFAILLRVRFEHTRDPRDLEDTVAVLREAVNCAAPEDPQLVDYRFNLSNALQTRFQTIGSADDADTAVAYGQDLVDVTPSDDPRRALYLENLGRARRARFQQTGALGDVDAAIRAYEDAVAATPVEGHQHARCLVELGSAWRDRFLRTGALADSDAALAVIRRTVESTADDPSEHARCLSNLGGALQERFHRTGALDDLDTAIQAHRDALDATSDDDDERPGVLNNIGIALGARFNRTGALRDLDRAVDLLEAAVEAMPEHDRTRGGTLSNLGGALLARFRRTGSTEALEQAIGRYREAIDAVPGHHPKRPEFLHNLGVALSDRFERTEDPGDDLADLDAAIAAMGDAVDGTPRDDPDRARFQGNLSEALHVRFLRSGSAEDLEAAIDALREAVHATPVDDPLYARLLLRLGSVLQTRFEETEDTRDLEAAAVTWAEAAENTTAEPSVRLRAARAAARLLAATRPERAAELLENAVRLLPEVAPRRIERGDQQHAIATFDGLAADAAALALAHPGMPADQRAVRALRLLEAGRTVILSQALDGRDDVGELRDRHPELAARFVELRELLDRSADTRPIATDRTPMHLPDRRSLADAFASALAEIRAREGFASFGLPPTTAELLAEAHAGPVVTLNVSSHRSDALLLTPGGIVHVALPELDHDTVVDRVNAFHQDLAAVRDAAVPPVTRVAAQARLRTVLGWLWDAAMGPVLDALGYTGRPPGDTWPRVWWCPTGPLALLPLHAAGHHTDPSPAGEEREPRAVMDRVVSSYTPTIRALRHARRKARAHPAPRDRSLIVAMSATPGLPDEGRLPNVPAEAAKVRSLLPRPVLLADPGASRGASGAGVATRAGVLAHLPDCTIAHFACHGYSDPTDPSRSRLLLHDHLDAPLDVGSLAVIALDRARLAYLSACSTALSADKSLLDEAIHLASAFQIAGFPQVIGTLWEINDEVAVTVAASFYAGLTADGGHLDTGLAARALHDAVRQVRGRYPGTPSLWAAYLHTGG
ncbi:CHAT domain-containing protein [Streptomyces sp. NPDC059875]|uniref:CHAT domain-containing protein n=1 Tax=unclassified Streptomyces TaxID=2593676 RepID=UPI003661B600